MIFFNNIFQKLDTVELLVVSSLFSLIPFFVFIGFLSFNSRRVRKYNSNLRARDTPRETKWSKMRPRLLFTLKDGRPLFTPKPKEGKKVGAKKIFISKAFLFYFLIILNFLIPAGLFFVEQYSLGMLSPFVLFFSAIIFALNSPVKIMERREKMYKRMYQIASSTLGIENELKGDINSVVSVKKWDTDGITPLLVDFAVPPTFNSMGENSFLEQFNQVYGTENAWVARSPDPSVPGWDYEKGVVHLFSVPPIPQIAPWSERYVLDPGIAWSFFPVGLGAENGVEMTNPETGEKEHVLGFDVAGKQKSFSEKFGYLTGSEIVTSPMALVAGGTGGGKAISCDTPVVVFRKKNEN